MTYPLRKSITSIGRHSHCDVVVPASYRMVSRQHAQIRREGSYHVLYDTSSAGTSVNGREVRRKTLRDRDHILLAGRVGYVYSNGALYDADSVNSAPYVERSAMHRDAMPPQVPVRTTSDRRRVTAALLAFFLGGIGAHKFYLGRSGEGLLYLLLCWTGIPAILGLIDGIGYLSTDDVTFAYRYP